MADDTEKKTQSETWAQSIGKFLKVTKVPSERVAKTKPLTKTDAL
jgi:hypothetical protein